MKTIVSPLLHAASVASLGERVRMGAAAVMAAADFVVIHQDKIKSYAENLLEKYPLVTVLENRNHFVSEASPAMTAAYVLALDSINFGSGYFDGGLEYEKIAGGLKKAFLCGEMNTPEKWRAARAIDFIQMFDLPSGPYDDLMAAFALHMNETGQMMLAFNDDPLALVTAAQGSAERLAEIVSAAPNFHDVAEYKGMKVPFFKRAQILAADLHLAGVADFKDMESLTIFADNMVPHVLRCDGIIGYTQELAAQIDGGQMIEAGSAEETEMRAAAVHTVELMRAAVENRVTSVNFDHILWHRGYEPDIYARPRHMTKTVWY